MHKTISPVIISNRSNVEETKDFVKFYGIKKLTKIEVYDYNG